MHKYLAQIYFVEKTRVCACVCFPAYAAYVFGIIGIYNETEKWVCYKCCFFLIEKCCFVLLFTELKYWTVGLLVKTFNALYSSVCAGCFFFIIPLDLNKWS